MWAFLASAVGPLAIRALVAIGFTSVTFAGVTTAFTALTQYAQSSWGALPASVLQLASLCRVPEAIGLVFGAMAFRLALWSASNGVKLIYKG